MSTQKQFNPTFLLICTGKYRQWLQQCRESILKYFPYANIYIFGDDIKDDFRIEHQPWPYVTLLRFHYFIKAQDHISGDYIYYLDVDAKFVSHPDIMGDLVAVRHCAYYFDGRRIPNERNERSVFFNYKFNKYYGGGFFGGNRYEFFRLCNWCKHGIDKDLDNGIIPVHNDETALNAYLSIHPPQLELPPDYHYPENDEYFVRQCWGGKMPFKPVIMLINKFKHMNIDAFRS